MLSQFLKNLSILKKFLFINFLVFLIIGILTIFYLNSIKPSIIKNKRIINGPRNIDIDIIFYGKKIYQSSSLTIPHPRVADRDFVLYPILDIDPFFQHPIFKKSVKTLTKELKKKFIIKKLSYRNLV